METTCHSGNLCAMCAATSIRCLCVKRKDGQYRYRQKIIHLMEGRVPPVWGRDADGASSCQSSRAPARPPIPFTRPCLPWNKPSRLSAPARETDTGTRVTGDPRDLVGLPIPPHPPNLLPGEEARRRADPVTWGTGLTPPGQWPHRPRHLTLRTDTRKTQGSSRPVAGLALILHTKVNLFRHRTQFSCTSSLRAREAVSTGHSVHL